MTSESTGTPRRALLGGGISALLLSACSRHAVSPQPQVSYPEATAAATKLGTVATKFGERLLRHLADGDPNRTVLISPLNALTPLLVLGLGARGDTAAAIASGLGFGSKSLALADAASAYANIRARLAPSPAATLGLANGLWVDAKAGLDPAFAARQAANFGARIARADLSAPGAAAAINQFVSEATRGNIPNMVAELPADSSLVIASALYFKGGWNKTFDPKDTRPGTFTRADGVTVAAEFMHDSGEYAYGETADLQAVNLYYADPRYNLVVVMTKPGVPLSRWSKALALDQDLYRGQVILPRLNLNWNGELGGALDALGMKRAFSPRADFGGMASGLLRMGKVAHRAYLTIDEQGAEAAAASDDVAAAAPEPTPFVFRADRPFHLVLRESGTGMPLFMAYVAAPTT